MTITLNRSDPARCGARSGAASEAAVPELLPGAAGQRTRQGPRVRANPAAWDERGNGHTAIQLEAI